MNMAMGVNGLPLHLQVWRLCLVYATFRHNLSFSYNNIICVIASSVGHRPPQPSPLSLWSCLFAPGWVHHPSLSQEHSGTTKPLYIFELNIIFYLRILHWSWGEQTDEIEMRWLEKHCSNICIHNLKSWEHISKLLKIIGHFIFEMKHWACLVSLFNIS